MVTECIPKASPKPATSHAAELALLEIEIAEHRIAIELAGGSHEADRLLVPLFELFRRRLELREVLA